MKAQVCASRLGQESFGLKNDKYRISKHKLENGEEEMQAYFSKLKELVPSVAGDKKVSKVQLLQHVIDYILDLELTLDTHPTMRTTPSILQALTDTRKPLTESMHLNTLQSNYRDTDSDRCPSPLAC